MSCDQYGNVGSSSGGSGVSFSFVNRSGADVQVSYLTSGGAPGPGGTIAPGQTFSPSAATGQDWIVDNSESGCLSIFAINGSGEVVVS